MEKLNMYEISMKAHNSHQLLKLQGRLLNEIEEANFNVKTDDITSLSLLHKAVSNVIEELQSITDINSELVASIVKMIDGE